jgi:hypothetical protein
MTDVRSHTGAELASSTLLAGLGIYWFSHTVADPDIWGHLRFGQDILQTGSIVQTDVYSYRTAGARWINHEWLSEVAFAATFNRAGATGLIAVKVLVGLLVIGLCRNHLARRGLGPFRSVSLLVLLCIPFRMGLGTVRPQIFTYVAFLFVLLLLEQAKTGRELYLWALPAIVAVWVNLHGGVLAGIGTIGVWIGVRIIQVLRNETGLSVRLGLTVRLLALGSTCGLALFLNPYGERLVAFLFTAGISPRPEISEWTPLALWSLPGLLYLVLLAIGIAGLAGSRQPRRPEAIVIFTAVSALPFFANRHYPLFALTLVVSAGAHIADASNRWAIPAWSRYLRSRLVTAACVLACLVLLGVSWPRFGCIRVDPYYFPFPARAVALLNRSGIRGNMAVPFDWGEYVLWHLGPGVKVSIDGRRETLYSDDAYRQSLDLEHGRGVWDALLKTAPTDLALTSNVSPTTNLLSRTEGWVPLYQDTFCVLFARAGFVGIGPIAQAGESFHPGPLLPPDGRGLCFPAPDYGKRVDK